ncbi:uncharacterized protein LOC110187690 [Drosophila serrata]|uniref:uncharacterized protein LOC110187690 n=1 Tax=Drosophila serrata TaxID=7274 RepID=UPI000A1CF594|nr:uncharacterized protein LOC110187690 [Drosophila serrata]
MALEMTYIMDKNSVPWLLWRPPKKDEAKGEDSPDNKLTFDGPQVVAFHFLTKHGQDLVNSNPTWLKVLDQLAQEYAGRIRFSLQEMSTIGEFNENLNAEDFGSYRKGLPPRIYGKDSQGRVYEMHKLVSHKYLKEFCEQLLHDQLFRAVILGPSTKQDSSSRNYFELCEQRSGDMLVMLYDPASYYWTFQERKLRKLVRLLAGEDLPIVVVDKANNYLGVGFNANWQQLIYCHSSTIFSSPSRDGWDIRLNILMETTRQYLRHIAGNRKPELKNYDAKGELRGPVEALDFIQYLY